MNTEEEMEQTEEEAKQTRISKHFMALAEVFDDLMRAERKVKRYKRELEKAEKQIQEQANMIASLNAQLAFGCTNVTTNHGIPMHTDKEMQSYRAAMCGEFAVKQGGQIPTVLTLPRGHLRIICRNGKVILVDVDDINVVSGPCRKDKF